MTSSAKLRKYFDAGRPLVEQWLGLAEQFAALRDAARVDEVDWAQVKALLKATIQDEQDGGQRVEKLLSKADSASEYAALLGLRSGFSEKNISREPDEDLGRSSAGSEQRSSNPPVAGSTPAAPASSSGGVEGHAASSSAQHGLTDAAGKMTLCVVEGETTHQAGIKPGPLEAHPDDDGLSIPPALDRRKPAEVMA